MNFITDNFITNMYGPYFLGLYLIVLIALYAFASLSYTFFDNTSKDTAPRLPVDIDPYEIAFIRAGALETIKLILASLIERKYVISSSSKNSVKQKKNHPDVWNLNHVEKAIFYGLNESTRLEDVVYDKELQEKVSEIMKSSGLLKDHPDMLAENSPLRRQFETTRNLAMSLALLFGGYKLIAALSTGHQNIMFLVFLAGIGSVVIYKKAYFPRLTRKGKQYVKNLQAVYQHVQYRKAKTISTYSSILLAGILGTSFLDSTPYSFLNSFKVTRNSFGSGCSSSCGSGCGGSCGGGCGGCGGCGG